MQKTDAQKVLHVLDKSTAAPLRSQQRIRRVCTRASAELYSGYVGSLLGEVATRFHFALWAEHPDLEPVFPPGTKHYDPHSADLPKADVLRAARALLVVRQGLAKLDRLLAGAVLPRQQRKTFEADCSVLHRGWSKPSSTSANSILTTGARSRSAI